MKLFLVTILSLPMLALAGLPEPVVTKATDLTAIQCTTMGTLTSVVVNISSPDHILHGDSTATLMANGMLNTTFNLQLSPIENDPNVATLAVQTQAHTFNGSVPITGIISIGVQTLLNGTVVPTGEGKIILEGTEGTTNPRLFPQYNLENCVGVL